MDSRRADNLGARNVLIMLTPAAMLALVAPFVAAQESQAQPRATVDAAAKTRLRMSARYSWRFTSARPRRVMSRTTGRAGPVRILASASYAPSLFRRVDKSSSAIRIHRLRIVYFFSNYNVFNTTPRRVRLVSVAGKHGLVVLSVEPCPGSRVRWAMASVPSNEAALHVRDDRLVAWGWALRVGS